MKKFTYTLILAASLFASCNSSTPKSENTGTVAATADTSAGATDTTLAIYQCPMKCEGHITYAAAGQCSVCSMDLEKL